MWDRNDHGDQIKQSINSDPLHRKSWPSAPQRRCRIDANELTCRFHTNQYVTHMKFPTGCRHDPRVYPHKLYFLHGSRRWNTRRMMRFVVLRIVAWPARWFSILFPALFVVFVRLIPISSLWRNRLGEVGTWFGFLFSCRNDSFVIIGCVRNQLGALPDVYSTRENATDIKINLVLVQNRFERSEGKQICIHDTNGYVNICVSSKSNILLSCLKYVRWSGPKHQYSEEDEENYHPFDLYYHLLLTEIFFFMNSLRIIGICFNKNEYYLEITISKN